MWANLLRLAQGLLRCGRTPFSSFLIWILAGDWLLPGWRTGGESYPTFSRKFGGHTLGLCFGISLREVVLKVFGRPMGKTAASIPRLATQTPGYVKEYGLGTLNSVWICYFGIPVNVVNRRVRAQLSLVEKPLLGGRHVSAPILGHHQVSKKYLMRKLCRYRG
jgi:hypothetical protein